jgi:electron transport complex protein RnfA
MAEYLLIPAGMVLLTSFVTLRVLGLSPVTGIPGRSQGTAALAIATLIVLALAAMSSALLLHYLLTPLTLARLSPAGPLLVAALVVLLTDRAICRINPLSFRILGVFLPLIAADCAVLSAALYNGQQGLNLLESVLLGGAAATGFGLLLIIFATLRSRISRADVPRPLRGLPLELLTAGLLALAFSGCSGLVRL